MSAFIKGKVTYYGKVNKVTFDRKGNKKVLDDKEYVLTIIPTETIGLDKEVLDNMYDGERHSKEYDKLLAGEFEATHFHSNYPVDYIYVGGNKISLDDYYEKYGEEVALKGATIKMTLNKKYIGYIQLLENGKDEEFNPFDE